MGEERYAQSAKSMAPSAKSGMRKRLCVMLFAPDADRMTGFHFCEKAEEKFTSNLMYSESVNIMYSSAFQKVL
jgi:hypothetical protein